MLDVGRWEKDRVAERRGKGGGDVSFFVNGKIGRILHGDERTETTDFNNCTARWHLE